MPHKRKKCEDNTFGSSSKQCQVEPVEPVEPVQSVAPVKTVEPVVPVELQVF